MKKAKGILLFALLLLFLSGCSSEEKEDPDKTYLYFINNNETKLVFQEYETKGTEEEDIVNQMLSDLQGEPEDRSDKRTIPDNVTLPTVEFLGNNKIRLNFDYTYSQMSGIEELLRRAAIVKTLCQLEFVDGVEFHVDGTPLTDTDGQQVGVLSDTSFIDSFNYTEKQNIVLYYANEDKSLLKGVEAMANYDGTTTLERIIIDQLIKGTDGISNLEQYYGTIYATIPSASVCNSIETVDYICYVDLNSEFLDGVDGITDEMTIYSIVNSLTSLSTINKVKFTIDGKTEETFGSVTKFDQFFEMNYNLIEKSSETTATTEPEATTSSEEE